MSMTELVECENCRKEVEEDTLERTEICLDCHLAEKYVCGDCFADFELRHSRHKRINPHE